MSAEFIRPIHDVACSFALILDILLVAIIVTKTPEKLRAYSIVLLNTAIVESTTSAVSLFVFNSFAQLSSSNAEKYVVFEISGPCRLTGSSRLCWIGSSLLAHGHSQNDILLGFSFCYRYFVIKHASPTTRRLLLVLALLYAPTALVFYYYATTPLLPPETISQIVSSTQAESNYANRTAMLIGARIDGVAVSAALVWFQCLLLPVYSIIVASLVLVHILLARNLKMSEQSKQMHRQIIKALIVQATLPLCYIVAIITHIAQSKRLLRDMNTNYLEITISAIIFAASPLSTLVFIRPYRRAIQSAFARIFARSSIVHPVAETECTH